MKIFSKSSYLLSLLLSLTAFSLLSAAPTKISFVRPTNLMVATQMVKLSIDGKQIAKMGQGKTIVFESETGKHTIQTKVGLSLGLPNVTGFNGAKKFKSKVTFDKPEHFYKIVFKPALMGGKHHVIEIDAAEYQKLTSELKTE
jgi:hypothetical protein